MKSTAIGVAGVGVVSLVTAAAIALPVTAFALIERDLQYGSTGADVSELQEFLTAQGFYSGPITGNYYSLTRKGLIAFQNANGISPAAGYFGPLTRSKVNGMLTTENAASDAQAVQETGTTASPVKNDAMSALQAQLNALLDQIKLLTTQSQAQTTIQQQTQTTLQQTRQSLQQIQENTTPAPAPEPSPISTPSPTPAPTPRPKPQLTSFSYTFDGAYVNSVTFSTDIPIHCNGSFAYTCERKGINSLEINSCNPTERDHTRFLFKEGVATTCNLHVAESDGTDTDIPVSITR